MKKQLFLFCAMVITMAMPQQMKADEIPIDEIHFPDDIFRQYVLDNCDTDKDSYLNDNEIAAVLNIQVNGMDIANMIGIEYFTKLKVLKCNFNKLTTLNVTKNSALKELECRYNYLSFLDISSNTSLTRVNCDGNLLTTLDVSKNTRLSGLHCTDNKLTTLGVSNNKSLRHLDCDVNQLTELDVSKNSALISLKCSGNPLNSIDVSNNTALTSLRCDDNQLTTLDVSNNTALTDLFCGYNQLTSLDVSNNPRLSTFSCWYNQLVSLDLSKNTELWVFECSNNEIASLDLSNNTKLIVLQCNNNQLKSLDLSNNKDLCYLSCYNNLIKGKAMDNLIKSLPVVTDDYEGNGYGTFDAIAPYRIGEMNVVTKAQVSAAAEKNWKTFYLVGEIDKYGAWEEYEGSEPETIEITPMEEGESVVFVNVLDGGTSIYDIAVGNIYYCISSDDGSYNAAEGCIVVTKPTDDSATDGKDIFGEDFKAGYTGIVFKVPSGEGTVKVDAATTGSMTLKVKIGSNEPIASTVEDRQILSFPYIVSEDTYVYIYGGMNAAGAKGMRKAAGEDALKIYGIEVASGTDGIEAVKDERLNMGDSPVYNLNGQRVSRPTKGVFIQNGRKVLVK